jgi:protein subunit release factor B
MKFTVSDAKGQQLLKRMQDLGIREEDLVEKFIRGSGSGGQKINKTSSCVYLLHTPSRIEIKCQRERSQSLNRFFARRELCDRLEERIRGEKSRRRQAAEKIRRQKRRRSRRAKEKMLEDKRRQSATKRLRGPVRPGEKE